MSDAFSHFFVPVCLSFEKLRILTVIYYYLLLLNRQSNSVNRRYHLLKNQHQTNNNKSSHTNRGRKIHHNQPTLFFGGADQSYLFQSWRQIRRGLLASHACIIPEFSGACCLYSWTQRLIFIRIPCANSLEQIRIDCPHLVSKFFLVSQLCCCTIN